jgi:predicted transcriptional regulator with HTH domain
LHIQVGSIVAAVKNTHLPTDISAIQNEASPMEWLNTNTFPDSAIYTLGDNYDNLIPVYTKDNIYFRRSADIFLMSDDELENRWVIEHFFDVVDKSVVYGNSDIWLDKYIDTYQNKEVRRKILQYITGKTYPEATLMDETSVNRVLQKYADFKKGGFEKALKTYIADYILIDLKDSKYQTVEKQLSSYSFLQSQIKTDSFEVFKVR